MDEAKKLVPTRVKKYRRCASQVEIRILALVTFVRHSQRVYNNKKLVQNMIVR